MITRRQFLAGSSALLAGSALAPLASMARHNPRFEFNVIRRGVGTFTMQGGTMGFLAAPDALVVVDTQYPDSAKAALDGLRSRSDRRIDALINTHHHGDHTNGNAVFSPHAERFIAHEEAARLKKVVTEMRGDPEPEAYPTTTYADALSLSIGDEVVDLRHYGAAHTGGDSVIHFEKANVVHMGDLMFNRMPPFIDKRAGANVAGWMETLQTVHDRFSDETVFIHGHAGPGALVTGPRADLLAFRDFLGGLMNYVESGIKAGKSIDEMAVAKLPEFPEYYLDSWQDAIPNAIRAAHQELTSD